MCIIHVTYIRTSSVSEALKHSEMFRKAVGNAEIELLIEICVIAYQKIVPTYR